MPVTVDLDLGKPCKSQERRYVWVKAETGSMIGGRWKEVDQAKGPGRYQTEKMGREAARNAFENSPGHNDPSR